MKRIAFFVLCLWAGLPLSAQTVFPEFPEEEAADTASNRVKILNADILSFQRLNGVELQKLIGQVKLLQDSTYFSCDSAYYYEQENRLEAFSDVLVEMPDSVTMKADKASYDGNSRIAEVFNNIVLRDRSVTLTTDHLTYNREEEYGFFDQGGVLLDGDTELTSKLGYYFPQENMAYFRDQVVLNNPDYTLYTDTLAYDTELKIAQFVTTTQIISEDGDITTTSGNYNTEARRVNLFERSRVTDSTYILTADTLFYNDESNMGFAMGQVIVDQTDTTLQLKGNFGEFNRASDESMVTDNPVAIQIFDSDTLFLFADTLRSTIQTQIDTIRFRNLPAAFPVMDSLISDTTQMDSLALAADLLDGLAVDTFRVDTIRSRIFTGYYNVRFFMNELQGRCDSLVYFYDDSLLFLFTDPILWSDENQMYGDTIKIWMKHGEADSMWLGQNAFLVSEEDTVGFNQIKGKVMQASFRNGDLSRLYVNGNSESIYFAKEEDSIQTTYQGMNQALSESMTLYFADNDLQRIVFLSRPEGSFKPMFEVIFQPNRLDGMRWEPERRPLQPDPVQVMNQPWPPRKIMPDVFVADPLPFEENDPMEEGTADQEIMTEEHQTQETQDP